MSKKSEIVEAGLKLATSKKAHSKIGTIHLNRNIYQTVAKTDSEGRVIVDSNGAPIYRNQVYRTAGSYVSQQTYDRCLELEKEFKELNDLFNNDSVRKYGKYKVPKTETLIIPGVTNL